MSKLDNSRISKHLGQSSQYKSLYDPSLLVREPRQSNREHLDLDDDNLPFVGNDTWNAYEVSALTDNGLPVTGIAKIVYPCNSKYIVESKSIKLYFNSFNMTKLGKDPIEVVNSIESKAKKDLSELLEAEVNIKILGSFFFEIDEAETRFLEIELDEVLTSENGIPFSRIESSYGVSESKEKHDSRSEDAIKFEGST